MLTPAHRRRKGFGEPCTGMDDIAARANVSKQTVYAQFGSKEALFSAMAKFQLQSQEPVGSSADGG